MKTFAGMEVVMMVAGIVLLMSTPSWAQAAQPPASFCWDRITTCHTGTMSPEQFLKVCCPVVAQIVSNEKPCFCSVKSQVNATDVNQINMLLGACGVSGSVDGICTGVSPTPFQAQSPSLGPSASPTATPTAPPPPPGSNLSPSGVPPTASPGPNLSPSSGTPPNLSPSSGTPPVASPPVQVPTVAPVTPVTPVLPPQGQEPTPSPTLVEPPQIAPEAPTVLAPAPAPIGTTPESSIPEVGAANKITMAGSLSGGLVLLAYFLI